jgi:diguanylate cyclase (GGDEF)-like protein
VTETLTEEEKTWIAENPQVKIGYLNNYMPYCSKDEETGQLTGMLQDLLQNIKKEYDLDYQAVAFDSYMELKTALYDGSVDAIFPVYGNYGIAEKNHAMVSDAVTHSTMTVFNDGDMGKDSYTIAVSYSDPFQEKYVEINYPDAAIVTCSNLSECLDAVLDETADFTVVETAKVNESENSSSKIKRVQKTDLQEFIDICFAMKRGKGSLLGVLNKGIQVTDNSLITNSLIFHSQKNEKYTAVDFLRDHMLEVFLIMIVVFVLVTGMLVSHYISVAKSRKKLLDAYRQIRTVRWEAAHDALTGLLNRASFQAICENLKESDEPLALLIMDVDKFKQVNDRFGHETGDRALVKVSNVITQLFRSDDYIIRYAGDEFVVIMSGITEKEKDVILSKIERINEILKIPDYNIPKLSISAGAVFSASGYQDDLFRQADQALYETKKNGRCGCSFYGETEDETGKKSMPRKKNIS